MQLSILCVTLLGCLAWQVSSNPIHLGSDNSWHNIGSSCGGGHLGYSSWADTTSHGGHLSSCDTCGLSGCGGGCTLLAADTGCSGTSTCGCSSCSSTPTWNTCSGGSNCGCSSCGPVIKKLKSFVIPADESKGRLIIHHGKPILIKPAVTKFFVPASPVIVEPHLIHHPANVNVQAKVSSSCSAPVQVKPVVVRVTKEVSACNSESPCLSSGCSSCHH